MAGAPVDDLRTAIFHDFMATHPDQRETPYPLINGVDGNQWGTAFATGRDRHPIWRITGEFRHEVAHLATRGFHAPEWLGDMFTHTNDSPFCVMDRAFGITVFGANARVVRPYTVSVSSAGCTHHDSNGLDRRNPRSNDHRNFTSRGRISDAMVIRRSLVRHGMRHDTDLGHVLHLFLCLTDAKEGFCHPMVGTESKNVGGFGSEGERIAIAPWIDVTNRQLSPAGLVVARTLQNYGCYIGDNSGSASALKAQQENNTRHVWNGLLTRDSLNGIRWNDFVVIRRGWQ